MPPKQPERSFTDKDTGEIVTLPKKRGKKSHTATEPNPSGLPWFSFDVRRWLNSASVQDMSDAEKGVYIQILATLWLNNTPLPCDPWKLSRKIECRFENVRKFMKLRSQCVAIVESPCSQHVAHAEPTCSQCVAGLELAGSRFVVPQLTQIAHYTEVTKSAVSQDSTGQNNT